ncbi:hypothetical protein JCM14202_1337 [Agrilactobacillus composti DSM 18527 = JCM 14202]|uniref:hypothetical protein n=1 Tax=Agrilactobacillus composti TaxID=398555 RepID=UPI00042E0CEE|nr:hypothetical protein [Agrilactobacillus composti]GAF39474.1 hypothetical protein JCM14202_1337 [Agrilactobacillus composti DSM 18527 = JCM 14202]
MIGAWSKIITKAGVAKLSGFSIKTDEHLTTLMNVRKKIHIMPIITENQIA